MREGVLGKLSLLRLHVRGRFVMLTAVAPAVWWQKRAANAGHRSCRGKDPETRDRNGIVARVKIL
jgi:hypothetical protein